MQWTACFFPAPGMGARLYLVYCDVIALCGGPELGVDVDDLQRSGHHALRLLGAAWRLPEHGVEQREAEGEGRRSQGSCMWWRKQKVTARLFKFTLIYTLIFSSKSKINFNNCINP